jgi:small conductance mechanosensitive channel
VQGVVSNLASGITLVVTKPFEEGDYVEIDGTGGTVESISIFSTKLKTGDNKVIIIPNGNVTSANIVNYSTKGTRRLDLVVTAAYGTEIAKVKETVLEVVSRHEEIFEDPAPVVRLKEQGDSALVFTVRVWLKSSDYWNVNFDLNEELYEAFEQKGIDIPFPQLDVRVKQ